MNQQEIETKVKHVIHEQLDIPNDEIQLESVLRDFNIDSLSYVELLLSLEEVFEIDIPDEDAEPLKTVQEIVDYIVKRLS
ncbi:MAG: acyl carrier protein [Lentisphaeria bacterium]